MICCWADINILWSILGNIGIYLLLEDFLSFEIVLYIKYGFVHCVAPIRKSLGKLAALKVPKLREDKEL